MSIEKEYPAVKESPFDKLRREKEAQGWNFVGREGLTQTKFSGEAKFEEVSHQTEEDIRERYLEIAKNKTLLQILR